MRHLKLDWRPETATGEGDAQPMFYSVIWPGGVDRGGHGRGNSQAQCRYVFLSG